MCDGTLPCRALHNFSFAALILFTFSCAEPDPDATDLTGATNSGDHRDAGFDIGGDVASDARSDIDEVVAECRNGHYLGHLSPGSQGTHELKLSDASEGPHCLGDEDMIKGGTLQFTTAVPSLVEWTYVTNSAADAIGSRSLNDYCDEITAAPCQTGRSSEFFYDDESSHLLLSEMTDGTSSVPLHFEVSAAECDAPDEGWCTDGEYHHCYQGRRVDLYSCASEQCGEDGDCVAETCSSALSVAPGTTTEPAIIDGHRRGYSSTGRLDELADCSLDNILEDSADIFLAVDDIPAGHDLVIESLAQGSYGFFILSDCDADRCLTKGSMDEFFNNRLQWSPEVDSDSAIVAIRPSDSVSRTFSFALYFTPSD